MGLLDKLFGKKSSGCTNCTSTQDDTCKEQIVASVPIDMSKHSENLGKVLINMSKDSKIDMSKHTARVAMVMDYSGSMSHLFRNGAVQETITRLLPIALKFDDNGELESWIFSDGYERLKAVTLNNYEDYVKKVIAKARMGMGGTEYSPVLNNVITHYKDIEPSTIPAFVIFITDGENSDASRTDRIIRELSNYNMFVQFIGIGNSSFNYLEKLDKLDGRKTDNTGFITVSDMNKMTDEQLYTEILRQYKDWLNKR